MAQKFQDFAQKKKLKHAGDPDVCGVVETVGFNLLLISLVCRCLSKILHVT